MSFLLVYNNNNNNNNNNNSNNNNNNNNMIEMVYFSVSDTGILVLFSEYACVTY